MATIGKGDFVEWTGNDEQGAFKYVGEILQIANKRIKFRDYQLGEYEIPFEEGSWKKVSKPLDWDQLIEMARKKNIEAANKPMPERQYIQKERKVDDNKPKKLTKKVRGRQIYDEMKGVDSVVERLMEELNMTKAGARTYYSNYRRGIW